MAPECVSNIVQTLPRTAQAQSTVGTCCFCSGTVEAVVQCVNSPVLVPGIRIPVQVSIFNTSSETLSEASVEIVRVIRFHSPESRRSHVQHTQVLTSMRLGALDRDWPIQPGSNYTRTVELPTDSVDGRSVVSNVLNVQYLVALRVRSGFVSEAVAQVACMAGYPILLAANTEVSIAYVLEPMMPHHVCNQTQTKKRMCDARQKKCKALGHSISCLYSVH
eukprot:c14368_g1_i1.p1 GENE.c14368_g1_i1~~c14368_g1_i1.p1  ORF type:complete len:220 (+),score=36.34 c14368_g1_i1:582-1241(+)